VEESGGKIALGQVIEEGRYLVRATTKDGRVYEWIVETTGSKRIWVSSEYYDELKGETLDKLQLISYIPEIHFPREFSVSGHNLYLDLFRKTLTIDGREVKIVNFEENPQSRARKFGIKVETNLKSLRGTEIDFMFYDDGTVDFYINDPYRIHSLNIEPGNILVIDYGRESINFQAEAPIEPKELQKRTPIELGELSIDVEGKEEVGIGNVLIKVFGYDNFKTLQAEIENDEAGLLVKFDDGSDAYSRSPKPVVHVPKGAKKIVAVEIFPSEKTEEDIINKIMKDVDKYENAKKQLEEKMKSGSIDEEKKKELEGEMNNALGKIGEGIAEIRLNEQDEREGISKYLGVPPERLFVKPLGGSGEVDFEIYQDSDKGTLLAIVEVKTTTVQEDLSDTLKDAEKQLRERFMEEKYKNLEHGFAVAIYIEDPKKLLQPGENYDFIIECYKNPYKK
ncbi:MAG: hypothetical protein HA495_07710, partial [Thaumarchaeota archaeon]|nr:hypothetical protein [Nitrososphaerota archaeon]